MPISSQTPEIMYRVEVVVTPYEPSSGGSYEGWPGYRCGRPYGLTQYLRPGLGLHVIGEILDDMKRRVTERLMEGEEGA